MKYERFIRKKLVINEKLNLAKLNINHLYIFFLYAHEILERL